MLEATCQTAWGDLNKQIPRAAVVALFKLVCNGQIQVDNEAILEYCLDSKQELNMKSILKYFGPNITVYKYKEALRKIMRQHMQVTNK